MSGEAGPSGICSAQDPSQPFLFLHGWNGNGASIRRALPHWFTASHPCTIIDLPGHGAAADLPVPSSVEAVADQIAASLESDSRHHVVAFCMGGAIAAAFAARHRARVRSLTLVETPLHFPLVLAPLLCEPLGRGLLRFSLTTAGGRWLLERFLLQPGARYPAEFLPELASTSPAVSCAYLRIVRNFVARFDALCLRGIPLRRLVGARSPALLRLPFGRRVSAALATLTLPGSGHFPVCEAHETLFRAIADLPVCGNMVGNSCEKHPSSV